MKQASLLFRILIIIVACLGISFIPAQAAPDGAYAVHALVIQMDESGAAALSNYSTFTLQSPLPSLDATRFAERQFAPLHDADPVSVLLLDNATGAVVFQTVVAAPNAARGEFHVNPQNPGVMNLNGATIDAYEAPLTTRVFPVRLPVIAGATRVVLQPAFGTRTVTELDLSAPSVVVPRSSDNDPVHDIPATLHTITGYSDGPHENRIDVLILGDGYTQAQQSKFLSDAKVFADGMFSIDPYKAYRPVFNIKAVFGPSKQSGADQPGCPDNNPPMNGQTRKTRYNATFCYSSIARLLVAQDMERAFADADAAYPVWDEIWMVVNDTTYGGSGGTIAVASINPYGVQIQQHEVGHSLMRLADEYEYAGGGGSCNDNNDNEYDNCPPNVTDVTNRSKLKWNYWVSASTPIPTNGPLGDGGAAGLWRGAMYSTNYYRGCYNCIMRVLGTPFGKVAAERLPIEIYTREWIATGGSYYVEYGDGIDMIEAVAPDTATPVNIPAGGTQSFTVNVVGPRAGIMVTWSLDGTVVRRDKVKPGAVTFTLTPRDAIPGAVLTAQVSDTNAILHATNRGLSTGSVAWSLSAAGAPNAPVNVLLNSGFEDADPANGKRAANWTPNTHLKGKRICDDGLAFSGACYYQLQGKASGAGMLKQTLTGVAIDAGDLVVLTGKFQTLKLKGTLNGVAQLVWNTGAKTKIKLPKLTANSTSYVTVEAEAQVPASEARTLTKVIVKLTFATPGGKVRVDELQLLNYADFLTP